ncbi:MAG: hypothetical protein DRN81_03775 [Thermoproteota archaeon]|nr:MAG: hypothetical protein DRN81_03775 [Candidatus Korarchaeota archaeon]
MISNLLTKNTVKGVHVEPENSLEFKFNKGQRDFIEYDFKRGPLLVVAAAGSGKTFSLVHLVGRLVREGVYPEDILVTTFTKKSGEELRRRIIEAGIPVSPRMYIGTFHSVFLQFLRKFDRGSRFLNIVSDNPRFTIVGADGKRVFRRVLLSKACGSSYIKEISAYGASKGLLKRGRLKRGILGSAISFFKANMIASHDAIGIEKHAVRFGVRGSLLQQGYSNYERLLIHHDGSDLDDILLRTADLLKRKSELRDSMQKRFGYVLIDEAQDNNKVQLEIARLVVGDTGNICLVGDPNQSIFGFRGAFPAMMLQFEEHMGRKPNIVRLETNYRSSSEIVEFSERVVSNNGDGMGKKVVSDKGVSGVEPEIVASLSPSDAAKVIAGRLDKADNLNDNNTAVLFRINAELALIEVECIIRKIPYILGRPEFSFFRSKNGLVLMAYLVLAETLCGKPVGDKRMLKKAFGRACNVPTRYLGRAFTKEVDSVAKSRKCDVIVAMSEMVGDGRYHGTQWFDGMLDFYGVLNALASIPTLSERASRLYELYLQSGSNEDDEAGGDEDTLEMVKAFVLVAESLEAKYGDDAFNKLVDFYKWTGNSDNQKGVALYTIHQSKGLEWESVYVLGTEEGMLPHKNSLKNDVFISEERRLFYVAATRAKKNLMMIYRQEGFDGNYHSPSRFLEEGGVSIKCLPDGDVMDIHGLDQSDYNGIVKLWNAGESVDSWEMLSSAEQNIYIEKLLKEKVENGEVDE